MKIDEKVFLNINKLQTIFVAFLMIAVAFSVIMAESSTTSVTKTDVAAAYTKREHPTISY